MDGGVRGSDVLMNSPQFGSASSILSSIIILASDFSPVWKASPLSAL